MKKFFCFGKNDFCEDFMNCEGCEHFKDLGGENREVPTANGERKGGDGK